MIKMRIPTIVSPAIPVIFSSVPKTTGSIAFKTTASSATGSIKLILASTE